MNQRDERRAMQSAIEAMFAGSMDVTLTDEMLDTAVSTFRYEEERAQQREKRRKASLKKAQRFIDKLISNDYEPRSYSGRCMYGRSCVGVRVSGDCIDEVKRLTRAGASVDNMGFDYIVYWEGLPWPDSMCTQCGRSVVKDSLCETCLEEYEEDAAE